MINWVDKSYVKYWAWFFLPGHFIFYMWAGFGVWWLVGAFDSATSNNLEAFFIGTFLLLGGTWFLLGTYHVMWIDIRNHFIPYKFTKNNGKVVIKGLYLKEDEFHIDDIQDLTTFEVYTHWYKRVHTLFLPHVEHYKLTLKDGRAYHFHGSSTKVKEMLIELTGITEIQPGEE